MGKLGEGKCGQVQPGPSKAGPAFDTPARRGGRATHRDGTESLLHALPPSLPCLRPSSPPVSCARHGPGEGGERKRPRFRPGRASAPLDGAGGRGVRGSPVRGDRVSRRSWCAPGMSMIGKRRRQQRFRTSASSSSLSRRKGSRACKSKSPAAEVICHRIVTPLPALEFPRPRLPSAQ